MAESNTTWAKLRQCDLFRGVSDEIVRQLAGARRPLALEKGRILFHRGDPATAFYIVLDGWMKLARLGPQGGEIIVHVAKAGESFAEAAMFMEGVYPVDAEAITDVTLQPIEIGIMRARLTQDTHLSFAMLGSMSLRLRGLVDEIERLKGRSAISRVAAFLLELSEDASSADFALPFEKTLIAARLGITPESLSRALAKLRLAGLRMDKDRMEIVDPALLRDLAAGEAYA